MNLKNYSFLLASMLTCSAVQAQEQLPFKENFETEQGFNRFLVNDFNGDGTTWVYNFTEKCANYLYNSQNDADDWMFTPGLKLKKGQSYVLAYKCWTRSIASLERMVPTIGKSQAPDSQVAINPEYDYIMDTEPTENTIKFSVEEDGVYYLGFHCLSPKDKYYVCVDDIEIKEFVEGAVPEQVTELKVVPAQCGGLNATVSFKAPSVDAEGKTLSELTSINVYRSGETSAIKTFDNPQPGAEFQFEDAVKYSKKYTYTVIAENKCGKSAETTAYAYIGVDQPLPISNITVKEVEEGRVQISWDKPDSNVGVNGGYVDAAALTYTIKDNHYRTVASYISENTFLDTEIPLYDYQPQEVVYYTITASNDSYTSTQVNSETIVVGTPFKAPVEESFAYASLTYYPWFSEHLGTDEEKLWDARTYGASPSAYAADDDSGLMTFRSYSAAEGTTEYFYSPKFDVEGLVHPAISFYVYHTSNTSDADKLVLCYSDGGEFKEISPAITVGSDAEGWAKHVYRLPEDRKSNVIRIALKGISASMKNIHVDDIKVFDDCIDFAIEKLMVTEHLCPNKDFTISGEICNKGSHDTEEVTTILLTRNGEVIAEQEFESPSIEFPTPFTFNISENIVSAGETISYKVYLENALDEISTNDSVSFSALCEVPALPTVTDMKAEVDGMGVRLSWGAPEPFYDYALITDDFESYEPFIIDNIGDWTLVDGDGAVTGLCEDASKTYENAEKPMAYQVFNPEAAGVDLNDWYGQDWKSFSGSQYLHSMYNSDGSSNDDWIISPEVASDKPVSFMARSLTNGYKPEEFDILYSTDGKDVESFKLFASEKAPAQWKEYKYQLPKDAKYFAIHHITDMAYSFMIDDISYAPKSQAPEELLADSYRVYRDGKMISENIYETEYFDEITEPGTYNYKVTAMFTNGESFYQQTDVEITTTGIQAPVSDNAWIKGGKGLIEIYSYNAENYQIVDLSGRAVAEGTAEGHVTLTLGKGVYMIKLGNQLTKVVVL